MGLFVPDRSRKSSNGDSEARPSARGAPRGPLLRSHLEPLGVTALNPSLARLGDLLANLGWPVEEATLRYLATSAALGVTPSADVLSSGQLAFPVDVEVNVVQSFSASSEKHEGTRRSGWSSRLTEAREIVLSQANHVDAPLFSRGCFTHIPDSKNLVLTFTSRPRDPPHSFRAAFAWVGESSAEGRDFFEDRWTLTEFIARKLGAAAFPQDLGPLVCRAVPKMDLFQVSLGSGIFCETECRPGLDLPLSATCGKTIEVRRAVEGIAPVLLTPHFIDHASAVHIAELNQLEWLQWNDGASNIPGWRTRGLGPLRIEDASPNLLSKIARLSELPLPPELFKHVLEMCAYGGDLRMRHCQALMEAGRELELSSTITLFSDEGSVRSNRLVFLQDYFAPYGSCMMEIAPRDPRIEGRNHVQIEWSGQAVELSVLPWQKILADCREHDRIRKDLWTKPPN